MKQLAPIPERTSLALTEVSSKAALAFAQANVGDLNVNAALAVAESVEQLRALLDTPEVRSRIIALQDTSIGFRTDRDPRTKNKKSGEYNQPYDWPVVRDCALEAALRGLQWVGNQFNIITGRCYATKEAFEYLIKRCKHVTGFRPVISVPRVANGGALVECSATWKLNGEAVTYACTIPVKTDDFSGADQIIGKATRKFLKRCYEQMAGISVPEADTEDAAVEGAVDVTPKAAPAPRPSFSRPAAAPVADDDQIPGAEVPPVRAGDPIPTNTNPGNPGTANGTNREPADPQGGGGNSAPAAGNEGPGELTAGQSEIAEFVKSIGGTFDHFQAAMNRLGWFEGSETWEGYVSIPEKDIVRLLRAKHGVRTNVLKELGR